MAENNIFMKNSITPDDISATNTHVYLFWQNFSYVFFIRITRNSKKLRFGIYEDWGEFGTSNEFSSSKLYKVKKYARLHNMFLPTLPSKLKLSDYGKNLITPSILD